LPQKLIKKGFHLCLRISGAFYMRKPPDEEYDRKSKMRLKSLQRETAERRKGRDRRKGFDRRGGIDRRRDQDQSPIERKNITQD